MHSHPDSPDPSQQSTKPGRERFELFGIVVGWFCVAMGASTLIGWFADIPRMTDWFGSGISTLPNAAVAAVAAGLALVCLVGSSRRLGLALGAFTGLLGAATLAQHVTGVSLGIDTILLVREWGTGGTVTPGRMGPPASMSFTLLGTGLVALALRGRGSSLALAAGFLVSAIAMLSIVGYLYGADQLYSAPRLTAIATPTSTVLLLLGLGTLALSAGPELREFITGSTPSAVFTRRLVPLIIILPLAIGWLRVTGERFALYDSAFGASMRSIVEVTLLLALLLWTMKSVRHHERAVSKAHHEIRRQQGQLAAFLDTAAIGLHRVGPDGTILWANLAEARMLGYEPEEYIGRSIIDFHADRPVIDDILARLKNGESLRDYPARLRCKDGSIKQVRIDSSVLWENGRFVHTQCFTRDVTAQLRAEASLRENQERYERLLAVMPAAVYTCEAPDGRINYFNREAAELWGRAPGPDESGTRFCGSFKLRRPDGTELRHIDCPMALAVRDGLSFRNEDVIIERPDGTRVHALVNIDPIRDRDGTVIGAVNVFQNVTDRKRTEALLDCQKRSLEMVARGVPLAEVLEYLARTLESLSSSGVRLAIHLLDAPGRHFAQVIAPSFPEQYRRAVTGLEVSSEFGPCCHAVLTGMAVDIFDLAEEQRWPQFREAVTAMGYSSCWSAIIRGSDGRILGTFANYYATMRHPSPEDRQAVEFLSRTAALAVERTRADEALRESERQFHEMIDALPAAIYTTDAQGRLTYSNPAAVEFSGRTPTLGSDEWCVSWKLFYPDGTPMPHDECPMAVAIKEGRPVRNTEAIAERPDGRRLWFQPFPTPLRDAEGRIVGGINMLVDITERKQAELASVRLAAIVESSDDGMISKSIDGTIHTWNKGAEKIFGYTEQEAVGRNIRFIIPEDRLPEEERVLEALRRGETMEHYETVRRAKDGRLIDVSLTVSPLRNDEGEIIGASKVARDITERKQAEVVLAAKNRELERYKQELEQMVEERTSELLAVYERLRLADRMAAVGSLASGLAHDMKNVLAPLGMRLDGLLTAPDLPADAGADLAAICGLLDHLRAMASNLSLFAKDPNQEGTEGRTHLTPWCGQVRGFIDASAGTAVVINWDIPADLPPVRIAPHRLTQAVLNLVHNARDAIRAKGMGAPHSGSITVRARLHESGLVVSVEDDGCGMSDDIKRRCFEPFFTTKDRQTASDSPGGTGLGLSLAHAIVDRVGGRMEIESQVGRGTRVSLHLPVAQAAVPASSDGPPQARVSIADPRRRAIVHQILGTLQYEVTAVDSAAEDAPEPGGPAATLWVTDGADATPQLAAAFIEASPGRRVVLMQNGEADATAWESIGVERCELSTPTRELRAVLQGLHSGNGNGLRMASNRALAIRPDPSGNGSTAESA